MHLRIMFRYIIMILGVVITCGNGMASPAKKEIALNICLQEMFNSAPDHMTAGEMRAICREKTYLVSSEPISNQVPDGAVDKRLEIDESNVLKPFTFMAHQQNYILLGAHNFSGYSTEEYVEARGDDSIVIDDTEVQFQLSLKMPVAIDVFNTNFDIYGAYTVRSFWQLYNDETTPSGREMSSPFRETNHEPEVWLQTDSDFKFLGFDNVVSAFGFSHQSNGQADSLSRSWNRLYAHFLFQKGNIGFGLKPWYRFEEDEKSDDNPDITDFLGYGEVRLAYKRKDHVFSFIGRNILESDFSKGAVQFGWSFPLWGYPYCKGYVQYFSGYGESLIDYDKYVSRLGVGIILTDLL